MSRRILWARALGAIVTTVAVVAGTTAATHHDDPGVNLPFGLVSLTLGVALALVGTLLLAVQSDNRFGPLLAVVGGSLVAEYSLRTYGYVGLIADPGSLRGADVAAWLGLCFDALFFPAPLALALLLFPDGRLPSRRWRPVAIAALIAIGTTLCLLVIRPGPLTDETFGYDVPWGGLLPSGAREPVEDILATVSTIGVLLVVTSVVSLLIRYSHAGAEERQRIKPLSFAAAAAAVFLLGQNIPGLHDLGVTGLVIAVAVGFPVALAVGALRYRLWDLDQVVIGAIVYGALTVVVAALYVGVVVALGAAASSMSDTPALLPTVVATAVVAVVVTPLKERLAHAARRLVYGVRATPYEALAVLPRQLAEAPAIDEVLPRAADALTLGLGVPAARVRALLGTDSVGDPTTAARVAWSPATPDGPVPDLVSVTVRHLGAVVGDVAVQPWPDRGLSPADHRLLADLAAQAGPALRSVALTSELHERLAQITRQSDELRASRERIASAQIEERRRIERDIHDGAQQQLVAMAMELQDAETLLASGHDTESALHTIQRCRADVDACIDELRELARGIYPPVLAARGLADALRARARKSPGEVQVITSSDVGPRRYGVALETAVYFACLEAIQNATKHAADAVVQINLHDDGEHLTFMVSDDGPGFEPDRADGQDGTGLIGMADRIGAVGGKLTVDSAPGQGTIVRGMLPVEQILRPG
jgi:signal transduction histidine kinase